MTRAATDLMLPITMMAISRAFRRSAIWIQCLIGPYLRGQVLWLCWAARKYHSEEKR